MSDIQSRKSRLEERIIELEIKLAELKKEWQAEVESEQHKAIDQLNFDNTNLDSTFNSLKEFMDVLRHEFNKTFR